MSRGEVPSATRTILSVVRSVPFSVFFCASVVFQALAGNGATRSVTENDSERKSHPEGGCILRYMAGPEPVEKLRHVAVSTRLDAASSSGGL